MPERSPKVTFASMPVVAIFVSGERSDQPPGELPVLPNDGGLIQRLLGFMRAAGIGDALSAGHTGGGTMLRFFSAGDAKKVMAWLKVQGVHEIDFYDSSMEGRW